jgi:hypothetical protein
MPNRKLTRKDRPNSFRRFLVVPIMAAVGAATLMLGAAPAGASPAKPPGGDPTVPVNLPKPAVQPEIGILTEDGIWHVGEVAFWIDDDFRGLIFDTTLSSVLNFTHVRFVNSPYVINDRVSSMANAKNGTLFVHRHINHVGETVMMLPFGQCNPVTCNAYSSLGWADDELSSLRG